MELFYTTQIQFPDFYLQGEEAIHCIKSLRKDINDRIHFTDGLGNCYDGIITHTDKKKNIVTGKIEKQKTYTKTLSLGLCIAPTKNTDRMEWLIEKATELGVSEVQWIVTHHSQRKNISLERMQRIAIAAMKQSLQCFLPVIHPIEPFSEWLQKQNNIQGVIGYCGEIEKTALNMITHSDIETQNSFWICIGPEGDFTRNETEQAVHKGLIPVSIGSHRLRTETAVLTALAHFYLIDNQ
jgi:16S rRNA (uracil1498-N3)-methyltransferase